MRFATPDEIEEVEAESDQATSAAEPTAEVGGESIPVGEAVEKVDGKANAIRKLAIEQVDANGVRDEKIRELEDRVESLEQVVREQREMWEELVPVLADQGTIRSEATVEWDHEVE